MTDFIFIYSVVVAIIFLIWLVFVIRMYNELNKYK